MLAKFTLIRGYFGTANEARDFILYEALPIFEHLSKPLYNHVRLLAELVHIVSASEVTDEQADALPTLIREFQEGLQLLYGENTSAYYDCTTKYCEPHVTGDDKCLLNQHLLKHYPLVIKMCGPLFAYSMFEFESLNNAITQSCTGTNNVSRIVCFRILIYPVNNCELFLSQALTRMLDLSSNMREAKSAGSNQFAEFAQSLLGCPSR